MSASTLAISDRPAPASPVSAPDPLRDVSALLGMIDFTNIDSLLSDLADIPPLLPPAVLPPLKVRIRGRLRKDHTSTRRRPSAWPRGKEMKVLALLE
jgi:hypothetical protein